jgi:signal peptidase I
MDDPTQDTNSSVQKSFGKSRGWFKELLHFCFIAAIIVLPIRLFIAQPFIVSGASMEPTFEDGEYLIVDQISYRFKEPSRGDVIVFKYPIDERKFFIKRIIGLPGETVEVLDGKVFVNQQEKLSKEALVEPYTNMPTIGPISTSLEEGEYFVLGDNRAASSDSRLWGVLPRKDIVGRPIVRLFPLTRVSTLPGKASFGER